MKDKRNKIEGVVNSHPTLRKVSSYLSQKYGVDEKVMYNRFIDFLMSESSCVIDNKIVGVKCFIFDNSVMKFINRTILSEKNVTF